MNIFAGIDFYSFENYKVKDQFQVNRKFKDQFHRYYYSHLFVHWENSENYCTPKNYNNGSSWKTMDGWTWIFLYHFSENFTDQYF